MLFSSLLDMLLSRLSRTFSFFGESKRFICASSERLLTTRRIERDLDGGETVFCVVVACRCVADRVSSWSRKIRVWKLGGIQKLRKECSVPFLH